MKKIISIFLLIGILICALISCNNIESEEPKLETLEQETQGTGDEITEQIETKSTNDSVPQCYLSKEEVINAFSLEEYNSKIDIETQFYNIPNEVCADFSKFGFEAIQICQEWDVDDNGKHLDYECLDIDYHNSECTYDEFHRADCRLSLTVKKLYLDSDMTREEYAFFAEIDGIKIYKTKPDHQLYHWTTYSLMVNDRCKLIISIPEHIPSIVSENQAQEMLNQAIDLAKVVRATVEITNTN